MSSARIVRLLISLAGIAVALAVLFYAPFGIIGNAIIAFVIFIITGTLASLFFARLATQEEKIKDLRDRVDNPPA